MTYRKAKLEDLRKSGTPIKVTSVARTGHLISVTEHEVYGTVVNYRDDYGGGIRFALLDEVLVEKRKAKA